MSRSQRLAARGVRACSRQLAACVVITLGACRERPPTASFLDGNPYAAERRPRQEAEERDQRERDRRLLEAMDASRLPGAGTTFCCAGPLATRCYLDRASCARELPPGASGCVPNRRGWYSADAAGAHCFYDEQTRNSDLA